MNVIEPIAARKEAAHFDAVDASPLHFSSSLNDIEFDSPYIDGLLFEVTIGYMSSDENTGFKEGTSTEWILCMSWGDLVSHLPVLCRYEAENWSGDTLAEVQSVRLLNKTVHMSPEYQRALLSEMGASRGNG